MMLHKKYFALALILAVAASMLLSGCAANKHVQCCVKDSIYNRTSKSILADPECIFPGKTSPFGDCEVTDALFKGGVANCTNSSNPSCSSIGNQDECEKTSTCFWNESWAAHCMGVGGVDTLARWLMPICVDDAPASCINNRCTAMMCGYSDYTSQPPISSQDWDVEHAKDALPVGEASSLPKINLQSSSCEFKTMNRKLYNQAQKSKGALWVNAFRFGVGKSFVDYEQAKNFFPASDKLCNFNPQGTVDRFTVYLNEPSSFCGSVPSYRHCSLNDMNFTSEAICTLYCDGRNSTTAPSDCAFMLGTKYKCDVDNFAYNNNATCKSKCNVMQDPSICTANDTVAPFLESDGRFRMKYQVDYLSTTNHIYGADDEFEDACSIGRWRGEHFFCDDWEDLGSSGPWYVWQNNNDDATQYFESHKSPNLDFDYEYYANELEAQYNGLGYSSNGTFPFECKGSSDCISGVCDMEYYKRALCKTSATGTVDCGCWHEGAYQPKLVCQGLNRMPFYSLSPSTATVDLTYPTTDSDGNYVYTYDTTGNLYESVSSDMLASSQEWSRNNTAVRFRYYSLVNSTDPTMRPDLFETCGVPPAPAQVNKCTFTGYVPGSDGSPEKRYLMTDACPSGVDASNLKAYWEYDITFNNNPATKLGSCLMKSDAIINQPYLDMQLLGWCAGCTYNTLAVQKITFSGEPGGPATAEGTDQGWLKSASCYQWRAEFNYTPVAGPSNTIRDANNDGRVDASVSEVRAGGGGNPYDGNIDRGNVNFPFIGEDTGSWICQDEWNGASNWWGSSVPYPSAPYLKHKLTSYLQSNIMPILDELSVGNWIKMGIIYVPRSIFGITIQIPIAVPAGNAYPALDVCNKWGGEGAALHVIADTNMLSTSWVSWAFLDEERYTGLRGYLAASGVTPGLPGNPWDGYNAEQMYELNQVDTVIARANMLKTECRTPPLVGLAINGYDSYGSTAPASLGGLIGSQASPGTLFRFFFRPTQMDYEQRIARGMPDIYPGKVDVLMQEWHPSCQDGIPAEVNRRLEYSRSLLSNFSKPSLIWRFHFPNGGCMRFNPATGKNDYNEFLEYLFNSTGDMVDAGIIGLVYDEWMTTDGRGYGSTTMTTSTGATTYTGLTQTINAANRPLDSGAATKSSTPFCELQKNSKAVLGLVKYTYGQKLYADNKSCLCAPCTETDKSIGTCDRDVMENNRNTVNGDYPPQLYCNDGQICGMPDMAYTNFSQYHCPTGCVNASACTLCTDPSFAGEKSFCRIAQIGEPVTVAYRNYTDLTNDNYWEFIAGLPSKDKCCIEKQEPDQPLLEYTYASRSGSKQRSEFIQYPTRGEIGIDCGRTPDTSVLKYCGLKIPISQKEIMCFKTR